MFWFIVLLLLAGAGFYFYQKMMDIEREIRAEQVVEQTSAEVAAEPPAKAAALSREEVSDSSLVTPEVDKMTSKAVPVTDPSFSLEDEVLAAVENLPGMKQTEIYSSFADVSKKQLQQLLKELDDSGKLKREKKGNSYLLYPL